MARKHYEMTAIIYDKKGNILSIGRNNYLKSSPLQAHHAALVGEPKKIFLHAEIDAIIRCRHLDKAYSILITKVSKDGIETIKPCPICMSALANTNIKKIH